MAIDSVTTKTPPQSSSDAEFRQAIKDLKETYLRLGVKVKGKERALLGIGLPRAAMAAAATGVAAAGAGRTGGNGEEDGDEMNIG